MRAVSTTRPEDVSLLPISRSSGSKVLSIPLLWCCLDFRRGHREVLSRPECSPVICPRRLGQLCRNKGLLWWRLEAPGIHGQEYVNIQKAGWSNTPSAKQQLLVSHWGLSPLQFRELDQACRHQVQPGSNWLRPQHSFHPCSRGWCLLGVWRWDSGSLSPPSRLQTLQFLVYQFLGIEPGLPECQASALLTELHLQPLMSFL